MCIRIEKLEEYHTGGCLDRKTAEEVERKIAEAFKKAQDREKRKLNIIVSNLPESTKEIAEERKREDLVTVRN